MLTIISKHFDYPQSMCEYQASRDGRFGWLLCTAHEEQHHALEEIQAEIKLELLNSRILEVSKLEIEQWLKTFFADLHWKLHARLRKTDLREKGLSLFFAAFFDNELYWVQFGRIFGGLVQGKKLLTVGKQWKNYHVQSMDKLSLFGQAEEDIRVRPQRLALSEQESLILLPGQLAVKVFESGTETGSLPPLIESFAARPGSLWLILKNIPPAKPARKRKLTKWQISALVLILATILAVVYMAFGNRILDVLFHRARVEVNSGPVRQLTRDLISNVGKVVNSPARKIELEIPWSAELPFEVSAVPVFHLDSIFLTSGTKLIAYNKKGHTELWQKDFQRQIAVVRTVQNGLVVCLATSEILGLDFKGEELWHRELANPVSAQSPACVREITENEDKRVDSSITVIASERAVSVLDSQSGDLMSELQLTDQLKYLSDYDMLDFCFYAVVNRTIHCIRLKIVN